MYFCDNNALLIISNFFRKSSLVNFLKILSPTKIIFLSNNSLFFLISLIRKSLFPIFNIFRTKSKDKAKFHFLAVYIERNTFLLDPLIHYVFLSLLHVHHEA